MKKSSIARKTAWLLAMLSCFAFLVMEFRLYQVPDSVILKQLIAVLLMVLIIIGLALLVAALLTWWRRRR